jgi:hypothetical protein
MEAYKIIKFNDDGTRSESIMLLPPRRDKELGKIIKAKHVRMSDEPVIIEVKR